MSVKSPIPQPEVFLQQVFGYILFVSLRTHHGELLSKRNPFFQCSRRFPVQCFTLLEMNVIFAMSVVLE